MLWCWCTIYKNITIIIQKHLEVYGNSIEMSQMIFKCKVWITGKTPNPGNTKGVEIAVPLKYLSNFWKTLEMP